MSVGQVTPTDIDGRVALLERLVVQLGVQIVAQKNEMLNLIQEVKTEQQEALSIQTSRINALGKKMEDSFVGGIKMQLFGLGLATIGSILSIYA